MILDRLRSLDPRRFFRKKEPESQIEPEVLPEEEAIHPDQDETLKHIKLAVRLAFVGCYVFMVLFCLQFVGKVKFDIDLGITSGKPFHFTYDIGSVLNLLPLFAVLVVSFGILVYAKAWVNYFAEEKHPVAKWLAFSFGICAIGVVVLGSLSVNQEARQEDFRAGLIAEEQVDNRAAGQQAVIAAKKERLAAMKSGETWEAKAAREGSVGWSAKIELAKGQLERGEITQDRFVRIERAGTTALAADALDAEILADIAMAASSTTKAEVKGDVGAVMTDPVTAFVRDTTPWRMPLMVFTMDMILIFGMFLGDIRRKRLLAEWNAAVRRKADAQTQQTNPTPSNEQDAEDRPEAANSNNAGAEANAGGGSPEEKPAAETAQTVEDDIFVTRYRRRKTKQRRLRPATLEELRAAGLIVEPENEIEAVNDQDGAEGPEATQGVDETGLDESPAGPDGADSADVGPEADLESDLLDDEPQPEAAPEETDGTEQGAEDEESAPVQPVQTEEEAVA